MKISAFPLNFNRKCPAWLAVVALVATACATATPTPAPTASPLPTAGATETPSRTPLPPTPTNTPAPVEGTTRAQVYVRSGPGTGYASLGLIDPGKTVQVVSQSADGKWYAILYPAEPAGQGWVATAYVQVEDPAGVPSATVQVTTTPAGPTGVVIQKLNVRSGPGTSYDSLGVLPAQSSVVLTGKNANGTWLQIEYPSAAGGHGWVTAGYVQVNDTSGLPVLDEFGKPVPTGGGTGTPGPFLSPTPTVGPAPEDGDSPGQPAARVIFSPSGTRQFSYTGQVSAPQGDSQDWIGFTPYAVPAASARLTASLACRGNGSLQVELLQGAAPLAGWGTLQCGDTGRPVTVPAGGTYTFHLSAVAGSGQTLVAYTLTVRDEP